MVVVVWWGRGGGVVGSWCGGGTVHLQRRLHDGTAVRSVYRCLGRHLLVAELAPSSAHAEARAPCLLCSASSFEDLGWDGVEMVVRWSMFG